MQNLPENVVSVERDGKQIFGLDSQGNRVMIYNLDTGEWKIKSSLEPVEPAEVESLDWFIGDAPITVQYSNVEVGVEGATFVIQNVSVRESATLQDGYTLASGLAGYDMPDYQSQVPPPKVVIQ